MAKPTTTVKIKGLKNLQRAVEETLKDATTSKSMLNKIGKFTLNRIRSFARSGKSLQSNDDPRGFKRLSAKYIEFRRGLESDRAIKRKLDSRFFDPARSNVTLTGQLLKSLKSLITKKSSVSIVIEGKRRKLDPNDPLEANTNSEVYDSLVEQGRGFIGLDETGQERVKQMVLREVRRELKDKFKK